MRNTSLIAFTLAGLTTLTMLTSCLKKHNKVEESYYEWEPDKPTHEDSMRIDSLVSEYYAKKTRDSIRYVKDSIEHERYRRTHPYEYDEEDEEEEAKRKAREKKQWDEFNRANDPGFYRQYERGFDGENYDPALDGFEEDDAE